MGKVTYQTICTKCILILGNMHPSKQKDLTDNHATADVQNVKVKWGTGTCITRI